MVYTVKGGTKTYKAGDIVWGCAYSSNFPHSSMTNYQKPCRGMLVSERMESAWEKEKARYRGREEELVPAYFVPLKKNGSGLAWSKLVHISSRLYADTEKESIELYNKCVQDTIDIHEHYIEKLKGDFI